MTGPAGREDSSEARGDDHRGLIALIALLAAIGLFAGVTWVVIIGVLVATLFLHELGHYLTARWTGMKVTEFYVGFGPRVWSFRRGETEYGIKAVWAGAYVRIAGMNNLDPVAPADEHRSFRRQSYPRKLVVLTAGSAMHFVMALVFLLAVLTIDGSVAQGSGSESTERQDWALSTVSVDSAAAAAGLQPGDRLISVGGVGSGTFAEFGQHVSQIKGAEVEVVYLRDGVERSAVTRIGERLTAAGAAGIVGLIAGDRILAVEGLDTQGAPTYAQVADYARNRLSEPVDITIVDTRTGEPAVVEGAVITGTVSPSSGTRGFFGVSPHYPTQGLGVVAAAGESVRLLGHFVWEVVAALPDIVTQGFSGTLDGLRSDEPATGGPEVAREIEVRRLDTSHPDENRILSIFGVARIGADLASDGGVDVLILLVFVNIFLGVFNLLPLPPLDGGHVVVATYERIRSMGGRSYRVDASNLVPLTYAVVAVLLLIGGVALVRDILDPVSLG